MAKKRPYIVRDPKTLNVTFYESLDETFLCKKALVLELALSNVEDIKKESANDLLGSICVDEKFSMSLETHMHFLEFQLTECLFAMLLAPFQELPHWLWMLKYRNFELKQSISHYLSGKISSISKGKLDSKRDFLKLCLYSNFSDGRDEELWNKNLDNVIDCLDRMGSKFLDGIEYNAFKHGIRVAAVSAGLSVALDSEPDNISQVMHIPVGISYLELKDVGEGGLTVHQTTKEISYQESLNHIFLATLMLRTVKNSRLARIKNEKKPEINTFYETDIDGLKQIQPINRISFTA